MLSEQIVIFIQIVLIDLVLAGDNAIIIGMVASQFPAEQRKKIIFFLCSAGNCEATIPIIIALSPAKTKSIKTIWINITICSDNIIRSISYQHPFQQS